MGLDCFEKGQAELAESTKLPWLSVSLKSEELNTVNQLLPSHLLCAWLIGLEDRASLAESCASSVKTCTLIFYHIYSQVSLNDVNAF